MIDGIPNRPLYFYQKDIIGETHGNIHHNPSLAHDAEVLTPRPSQTSNPSRGRAISSLTHSNTQMLEPACLGRERVAVLGCWVGVYLVGGLEHFLFFPILGIIIATD
jgi:hypothetical protein